MVNFKQHCRFCLMFIAGLLISGYAHADKYPNMWGPKVVTPTSLHLPKQPTGMIEESFEYVPLHPVLFNPGKATIGMEGQRALDAAASYLMKHDNIQRILIAGSTDYIGNAGYNDRLSDRRSEMVRNYLTLKGVNATLIQLSGSGENAPVDQNWTRDGRQRNRHVAIYAIRWQR